MKKQLPITFVLKLLAAFTIVFLLGGLLFSPKQTQPTLSSFAYPVLAAPTTEAPVVDDKSKKEVTPKPVPKVALRRMGTFVYLVAGFVLSQTVKMTCIQDDLLRRLLLVLGTLVLVICSYKHWTSITYPPSIWAEASLSIFAQVVLFWFLLQTKERMKVSIFATPFSWSYIIKFALVLFCLQCSFGILGYFKKNQMHLLGAYQTAGIFFFLQAFGDPTNAIFEQGCFFVTTFIAFVIFNLQTLLGQDLLDVVASDEDELLAFFQKPSTYYALNAGYGLAGLYLLKNASWKTIKWVLLVGFLLWQGLPAVFSDIKEKGGLKAWWKGLQFSNQTPFIMALYCTLGLATVWRAPNSTLRAAASTKLFTNMGLIAFLGWLVYACAVWKKDKADVPDLNSACFVGGFGGLVLHLMIYPDEPLWGMKAYWFPFVGTLLVFALLFRWSSFFEACCIAWHPLVGSKYYPTRFFNKYQEAYKVMPKLMTLPIVTFFISLLLNGSLFGGVFKLDTKFKRCLYLYVLFGGMLLLSTLRWHPRSWGDGRPRKCVGGYVIPPDISGKLLYRSCCIQGVLLAQFVIILKWILGPWLFDLLVTKCLGNLTLPAYVSNVALFIFISTYIVEICRRSIAELYDPTSPTSQSGWTDAIVTTLGSLLLLTPLSYYTLGKQLGLA